MRPTFEQTVDILVKAYLNDTLKVGDFCACAVGNLIPRTRGPYSWDLGKVCFDKPEKGHVKQKKTLP